MELTKQQIKTTKGIAILFMLLLHLFCTKQYEGLFTPIIMIEQVPLIYYFALFADCCVAIYCFCSGYGLYISYRNNSENYKFNNYKRILKLYTNFWIILGIFVVVLGSITGKFNILGGGLKDFILTVTLINPTYNGAWWFLTTYIILVLISPILYKVIDKVGWKVVLIVSLGYYFMAYIQRIKIVLVFDNEVLAWFIRQIALFGTSQLLFIIGGIFAKYKTYSRINNFAKNLRYKNMICISIIAAMIIAHGIIQTLFVAVFTGIAFICVFNIMDKPKWLDSSLNFVSDHSTNMWLIHMFIYITYLKDVVFMPKYPVIIFPWFVGICIGGSYIINFIYKSIVDCIDKYKVVFK